MFISFEGPDGSGKTTQSKLLAEFLKSQGLKVLWTKEPGDCSLGKLIRNVLLENNDLRLVPLAELLLFTADRAQHVAEVIKPALQRGEIVICDRYIDSTTAYQAGGRGFAVNLIEQLNKLSTAGLTPKLTILIDVPVEIGLNRAEKQKFELEKPEFHRKVRQKYLAIAKKASKRIKVFNGTDSIQSLSQRIKILVCSKLHIKP